MSGHRELRQQLAKFLGEDRFRKFVRQGIEPRLKYWQERELELFFSANPAASRDPEDLLRACRICEVHGVELESTMARTTEACVLHSPSYLSAKAELFPHACLDLVMVAPGSPQEIQAFFCPACRVASGAWQSKCA